MLLTKLSTSYFLLVNLASFASMGESSSFCLSAGAATERDSPVNLIAALLMSGVLKSSLIKFPLFLSIGLSI